MNFLIYTGCFSFFLKPLRGDKTPKNKCTLLVKQICYISEKLLILMFLQSPFNLAKRVTN